MRSPLRRTSLGMAACALLAAGCGGSLTKSPTAENPAAATSVPPPKPTPPATAPRAPSIAETATTEPAPSTAPAAPVVLPPINPAVLMATLTEAEPDEVAAPGPHPYDYLWQPPTQAPDTTPLEVEVPAGLPPIAPYVPLSNPMTKAKYELGKMLYFDPRLSKDGTVSCATCHNPEKGWTDAAPVSTGIRGQKGGRSAPTSVNSVYGRLMFWDGRAASLEAQALGPIRNPIEMGDQTNKEIIERLRAIPGYREAFLKAFGTDVTLDGLAKAIATFERTALSGNSAYDKYVAGDNSALDESQKRGLVLFGLRLNADDPYQAPGVTPRKANCTSCHVGANFTDEQFHNLGVGYDASTQTLKDPGRWAATPIGAKNDADRGAFKTPTLRDLVRTAPYMHDGSEPTLEAVVEFYDRGGNPNEALDKEMKPLKLTPQEKADLVAFMKALTGEERKVELPQLPAGPDGKAPDPRAALVPPAPPTTAATE